MMKPTLPHEDPLPYMREKLLDVRRSEREYDYGRPDGVACLKDLPITEKPGPSYLLKIADSNDRVTRHSVSREMSTYKRDSEHDPLELSAFAAMTLADAFKSFWDATVAAAAKTPKAPVDSLDTYGALTDGLEPIPMVERLRAEPERRDELFAWQRLGGVNPLQLEQLRDGRVPDNLPVTEAHFQRAFAALRPAGADGDTLARSLAEGRLFLSDCALLDGVPTTENAGRRKYAAAPMGLFVRPLDRSVALLPVAIQCAQRPSRAAPIFTPADGWRWRIAQAFLSLAEGSLHEAGEHLGLTHLVVEGFALAAWRNLASAHPVMALLAPHFEGTHFINHTARNSLIADGGTLDQIMPQPIEVTRALSQKLISNFRIDRGDPATRLSARGLLDADTLPDSPYREDALAHWDAMLSWVSDYLRLYYADDDAVGADPELQGFVRELGARDGARLAGVPVVQTVDALARLLTFVMFTGSVQHAAVNFPQYPFMGNAACIPSALYAPPPTLDTPDDPRSLLAALPPLDVTVLQMYSVWQLSAVRDNTLGDYPGFNDDRVAEALAAYHARLAELEVAIKARAPSRPLPYEYLLPSLVPASIII